MKICINTQTALLIENLKVDPCPLIKPGLCETFIWRTERMHKFRTNKRNYPVKIANSQSWPANKDNERSPH